MRGAGEGGPAHGEAFDPLFLLDVGAPLGLCREVAPRVFQRAVEDGFAEAVARAPRVPVETEQRLVEHYVRDVGDGVERRRPVQERCDDVADPQSVPDLRPRVPRPRRAPLLGDRRLRRVVLEVRRALAALLVDHYLPPLSYESFSL